MATVQTYRIKQIEKIIDSVFSQFNITDPTERYSIATDIANRLNIGVPLSSSYSRSDKASSSKYRADVRAFLVDTISELLVLRDLDNQLTNNELLSRELIQNTSNKIDNLIKELRSSESIIVETFEEGLVPGTLINSIIKDGFLRIDNPEPLITINSIKYEVIPSASVINNTTISTSGSINNLISKGLSSDSLWINLDMPVTPVVNYIDEDEDVIGPVEGVFISIEVETENIKPVSISLKASTEIRIHAVYGYVYTGENITYSSDDKNWTKLKDTKGNNVEDTSPGLFTFVDNMETNVSSKYKILIHVPYAHSKTADNVQYKICLHNIKISTKPADISNVIGRYLSNGYSLKGNKSLIKVKLDTEERTDDESLIEYKTIFKHGDSETVVPILPPNTTQVVAGVYATDEGIFKLPFPVANISSFNIYSEHEFDLSTGLLDFNNVDYSMTDATSDSFLIFQYESQEYTEWNGERRMGIGGAGGLNKMGLNNAILFEEFEQTDHHDLKDGRAFKLTKTAFVDVTSSSDKFTIYVNNSKINFTDITPYDYPESIITFSDATEFYIKNNQLNFNFNLLDINAEQFNGEFESILSIKVVYKIQADSVQLSADLYGNNPLLDSYKLKLIGIDNGI